MKNLFGITLCVTFFLLTFLQMSVTSCTKDRTIYDTVIVIHKDTTTLVHKDTTVVVSKDSTPVVNAGNDTTWHITSGADSIRLSGSAKDALDPIVSYLWSEVSGPNAPNILSAGASTTYVTGLTAGVYVFQLMAVDSDGEVGVKTVTITVQLPQSLTLRLDNAAYDVGLAYNYGTSSDISDAHGPSLSANTWTNNGSTVAERGIFKFDLSTLPANAKIVSAKLNLYSNPTPNVGDLVNANFGSNNGMLIQRVTSNWNNTVTWQTQPSTDAASEIVIPATSQSFLDLRGLDVTNMVTAMQQSGNFGFLIRLQNEVTYNSRTFASSRYSDPTKHPTLVVTFN